MEFKPPEAILPWGDYQHNGLMFEGVCRLCFGYVDDPRHSSSPLLDGRPFTGAAFLSYTVFGRPARG